MDETSSWAVGSATAREDNCCESRRFEGSRLKGALFNSGYDLTVGHGTPVFIDAVHGDIGYPVNGLAHKMHGTITQGKLSATNVITKSAASADTVVISAWICWTPGEDAVDVPFAQAQGIRISVHWVSSGILTMCAPAVEHDRRSTSNGAT